jgi:hypothetical protein
MDMNDKAILPFRVKREYWTSKILQHYLKFYKFFDTESRRLYPALVQRHQSLQQGPVLTFGCSLTGTSTRMVTFRGFSLIISANRRSSVVVRLPVLLVCRGRPPFCTRSNSITKKNSDWGQHLNYEVADNRNDFFNIKCHICVQSDQKVSVHLMIQSRKLQLMLKVSPASLQAFTITRLTLTPSVIPNSNYVIMVSDWNCLKSFACFCAVIIRCTETFWSPCICDSAQIYVRSQVSVNIKHTATHCLFTQSSTAWWRHKTSRNVQLQSGVEHTNPVYDVTFLSLLLILLNPTKYKVELSF